MTHWNVAYSQEDKDFGESDCIISRYEDLVDRPEDALTRLGTFLSLTPRSEAAGLETRFSQLRNTNAKYIEAHNGAVYGHGIWNKFGYVV